MAGPSSRHLFPPERGQGRQSLSLPASTSDIL